MARKSDLKHYLDQAALRLLLARKRFMHSMRRQRKPAITTFVAGVQRSGTNMTMDVLEQSLETDVYHETDDRAFDNYQMRDPDTITRLRDRCRAPHFIVKSLCELQHLPSLQKRFDAKIIWIYRHYDDVVNSMLVSFGNFARQINRITHDPNTDDWRGQGMSAESREILRPYATENLDEPTAAALMWLIRNRLYFEHGFPGNERVLLVKYENLVSMPENEFRRIFEFTGIDYRPWHSRKVVPSSIRKKAPPVFNESVRARCDELLQQFDAVLEQHRDQFAG